MSMESILSFIKEYEYVLSIGFSAIAALFAVLAYFQVRRGGKDSIRQEIKAKQAQLDAMSSIHYFEDSSSMGDTMVKMRVLQSEIDTLKSML